MTNFYSSSLRQKIDQLMNILWAGGVNNPMDSIEQISYLIFLRLLSEKDDLLASIDKNYERIFSGRWARYSWGNFVTLTGEELFASVRSAIESLHELPNLSDTGRLLFERATLKIYDRPTLRAVVQGIHEIDLTVHDEIDLKGDMYEYLLSKISMSGTNGQFRTPRHIIDLIVAMVNPQPSDRICDPACGTAGFLIAAFNHILREHTSKSDLERGQVTGDLLKPSQWRFLEEQAFTGFDNDANMVKIAILNLYLHRLEKANIRFHNPLTTGLDGSYPGFRYDVILANPPFSGKVQKESILADLNHGLNTRATELLFLKWFLDHLAAGGRAGIIVPEGVVLGTDRASKRLRQMLLFENSLEAVVSLPHACFKPYASVATFVLIFRQGEMTERTWMYRVEADGYSQDGVRLPIPENDFPDLLSQWSRRCESSYVEVEGKHGWVSAERLAEQGFELAPRRYLLRSHIRHDHTLRTIKDLCTLAKGATPAAKTEPGEYPFVTTAEELKSSSTYQFEGEAVCIPLVSSTGHGHASIRQLTYISGKFAAATIVAVLQVKDRSQLLPRYLYYLLDSHKEELLVLLMKGAANVSLSLTKIGDIKIPVPPIDEQQLMIAELDNLDNELGITQARLDSLERQKEEALMQFKSNFSE